MSDDPIDLEELSASGQRPPPTARRFRIRVDLATYVVEQPLITGREILAVAGKMPPERYILRQRLRGHQSRDINLDDRVDLTEPGVERFVTLPRDQTDGILRRQFALGEEDAAALDSLSLDWETVDDGGGSWVLQHGCPVPTGFRQASVSIAVRLETGYPRTPLDMAYYDPPLSLASGRAIPASEAMQMIDGRPWQRWSRHYSPANPWRPGVDSVATHLVLARDWLAMELVR
jgi:hypothetical protein